jgi:hypothetical protein
MTSSCTLVYAGQIKQGYLQLHACIYCTLLTDSRGCQGTGLSPASVWHRYGLIEDGPLLLIFCLCPNWIYFRSSSLLNTERLRTCNKAFGNCELNLIRPIVRKLLGFAQFHIKQRQEPANCFSKETLQIWETVRYDFGKIKSILCIL